MNVAPAPVSTTGVLDFNALPERARQHLVDCLAGRAEPRLLASHNKDTGVAGPIAALPIVGLPLVGLLALQLGRPGDAWLGWTALFVLGPLVFGFILACLAIAYRLIRSRALPFPEGRFLFPLDVVETGWSVARWPILSAEKVDVVHQTNQGRYVSTFLTFKFPGRGALRFELRPRDRAEAALATLREAQNAVREAQSLGVPQALARLDPLAEV